MPTMSTTREAERFQVKDDGDTIRTVTVSQEFHETLFLDGSVQQAGGRRQAVLDDGRILTPIDSNAFRTLTGEVFRRT